MRKYLLGLLLLINLSGFAQLRQDGEENDEKSNIDLFEKLRLRAKPKDVKNTVFLKNDWANLDIVMQTGEEVSNVIGKYDVRNKQFEIRGSNKVGILRADRVQSFKLGGTTLEYTNIKTYGFFENTQYKHGFVTPLFMGNKRQVFKYSYAKITESSGNMALATTGGIKFSLEEEVIVLTKNGFSKLESSKKKNLKFFGDAGSEVLSYVKENKLSFKKEEDVKKVFEYYDSISSK